MHTLREIIVSLLHLMLEAIFTLNGAYVILKNKTPLDIIPSINIISNVGENIKNSVETLFKHPEQGFDLNSPSKVVSQFHELSSQWKEEIKPLEGAIHQIQELRSKNLKMKSSQFNGILDTLPTALGRIKRYIEYFSEIEENDLLHWDNERLLRLSYPESYNDYLG